MQIPIEFTRKHIIKLSAFEVVIFLKEVRTAWSQNSIFNYSIIHISLFNLEL